MAIDTALKRRIALGSATRQGRSSLDGAISTALERANVLGLYFSGSAAAAPEADPSAMRGVFYEHSRGIFWEGR